MRATQELRDCVPLHYTRGGLAHTHGQRERERERESERERAARLGGLKFQEKIL